MKVTIDQSFDHKETEIIIKCSSVDIEIERLISLIKGSHEKIHGILNGTTYFIDPKEIFYFESVDKKTFVYTKSQVFETSLRLYEIEEKLASYDFFRASKSTIINLSKIQKISPKFNGKLQVLLENNENLMVSRQYVPVIKKILDL